MFYVYILRTSKETLYVGQTINLEKRLKEHKSHSVRASKYVRSFTSFELVYKEEFSTRSEAMKREYEIKHWSKAEKEDLIKKSCSNGCLKWTFGLGRAI